MKWTDHVKIDSVAWDVADYRDGETATAMVGSLRLYVSDQDGDSSYWEITRATEHGSQLVARSSDYYEHSPYHFDTAREHCLAAAVALDYAEREHLARADEASTAQSE